MATVAELQVLLSEAETAYHSLSIGESVVEVRNSSGSSVRYTPANMGRLRNYIRELKAQIANLNAGVTQTGGPMRLTF